MYVTDQTGGTATTFDHDPALTQQLNLHTSEFLSIVIKMIMKQNDLIWNIV